jgi:Pyridoxamine 5'-phosphate oxidase
VRETAEDLQRLQDLLDRSYEAAGAHLREVITPERRLTASQVAERLEGMCLLTLATVSADGRPINGPVDGFFYRGEWYFGSSHDSLRFRHLRQRPFVSATHLPAEALSVTTHGRALEIDIRTHEDGAFRQSLLEYYGTRYAGSEAFIDSAAYARIEAERMFTFYLDPTLATEGSP